MRDTVKYPITPEEVDEALNKAWLLLDRELVGDARPLSVTLAREFLRLRRSEFEEWLAEECVK